MCRSWFLSRCNEVWSSKGLSTLLGHSFKIGGTTHLLLLGINPFIMMAQGHGDLQPSWIIGDCVGDYPYSGWFLHDFTIFPAIYYGPV